MEHICPNPLVVNKIQWKMFEKEGFDMSHFVLDKPLPVERLDKSSVNRVKENFYLDHPIEANCDEDGETFICYGTKSKLRAFQEIKSFCRDVCGLDDDMLPKMADLETTKLWYGLNKDEGDDWYWWNNPPKSAKYLGLCWKYEIKVHSTLTTSKSMEESQIFTKKQVKFLSKVNTQK